MVRLVKCSTIDIIAPKKEPSPSHAPWGTLKRVCEMRTPVAKVGIARMALKNGGRISSVWDRTSIVRMPMPTTASNFQRADFLMQNIRTGNKRYIAHSALIDH